MNNENSNDMKGSDFEACTGCGDEAFVCIIGNGDPTDDYNGPYALCQPAFEDWLVVGDDIVLQHD